VERVCYTGPDPRMGPIDNFSLVTGPLISVARFELGVETRKKKTGVGQEK